MSPEAVEQPITYEVYSDFENVVYGIVARISRNYQALRDLQGSDQDQAKIYENNIGLFNEELAHIKVLHPEFSARILESIDTEFN